MYMQIFPICGIRIKFSTINARRKLVEKLIFVVTDPTELTLEHKRTDTLYKYLVKFTFANKSIYKTSNSF
jgi:hypothetical protein